MVPIIAIGAIFTFIYNMINGDQIVEYVKGKNGVMKHGLAIRLPDTLARATIRRTRHKPLQPTRTRTNVQGVASMNDESPCRIRIQHEGAKTNTRVIFVSELKDD